MKFSDLRGTRSCRRKRISNTYYHPVDINDFRYATAFKRANEFYRLRLGRVETVKNYIATRVWSLGHLYPRWNDNTNKLSVSNFPLQIPDGTDVIFHLVADYSSNKELYH